MRQDVKPIVADMTVAELAKRMGSGDTQFNLTQGLPIVSAEGKLVGIVTQGDLLRALETDPAGSQSVLMAGSSNLIVAYPDELVHDAMHSMVNHDIGRLPVVSREDPQKLLGYFNRSSLLTAFSRQTQDENLRERGWIQLWRKPRKPASPPGDRP